MDVVDELGAERQHLPARQRPSQPGAGASSAMPSTLLSADVSGVVVGSRRTDRCRRRRTDRTRRAASARGLPNACAYSTIGQRVPIGRLLGRLLLVEQGAERRRRDVLPPSPVGAGEREVLEA